jgi:competence protein ComEC
VVNASATRTQAVLTLALPFAFSIFVLGSMASGQATQDPRPARFVAQPTSTAAFQVDYIDVGQGDAIYLHASDGTDILIDGGPRSAGPTVVAHLQDAGVDDIEVMVLTHPDADHEGGLIDVLRSAIPVESWISNGQHDDTLTYQALITETMARGLTPTPAVAGQSYRWGDVQALVLNPQPVLDPDQNDNSVTLLVVYGDVRFLFTGDITTDAEQVLLETGTASLRLALPAEVLKVAHHGSRNSSSADFLEAVNPEVAIISVGGGNPYGHPAPETLDRLAAAGANVYRTDKYGTITVISDGQSYEVLADFVVFLPFMARQPTSTNTRSLLNQPLPRTTPTVPPPDRSAPTNRPPATLSPEASGN